MAEVQHLPSSDKDHPVVVIDYDDLVSDKDLSASIEEAYNFEGLGILAVRGVPNMSLYRKNLLPLSHKFANLPEHVKEKMVHPESYYSFGWSHGKEKLEGKPDYSKGSYYNNPQYDVPVEDEELIKKYPSFCTPNIWPKEDLPELEGAFKQMGQLVVEVGLLLANQCDRYVHKQCPTYPNSKLHDIIKNCRVCKARLLHYFPIAEESLKNASKDSSSKSMEEQMSSWCGWHNDHGSLTGLVPALYLNEKGEEVPNPDPSSGLYIRSRSGQLVQVKIPPDHLAFQIGETSQIHSGGILQATPHCVKGAQGEQSIGISRETFAVFMEPNWYEKMNLPEGADAENVTKGSSSRYLPPGVPQLGSRWRETQDFGEFTEVTLKSYY